MSIFARVFLEMCSSYANVSCTPRALCLAAPQVSEYIKKKEEQEYRKCTNGLLELGIAIPDSKSIINERKKKIWPDRGGKKQLPTGRKWGFPQRSFWLNWHARRLIEVGEGKWRQPPGMPPPFFFSLGQIFPSAYPGWDIRATHWGMVTGEQFRPRRTLGREGFMITKTI